MFWEIVKSPVVFTEIIPAEFNPLYVVLPARTDPIVRSPVLTTVRAPTEEPEAMVLKVLLVLLSVIALLPTKAKP